MGRCGVEKLEVGKEYRKKKLFEEVEVNEVIEKWRKCKRYKRAPAVC
jgi:hypothetical protein